MQNSELKTLIQFSFKFITKYFLYGYLCIFGIIIIFTFGIKFLTLKFPLKLFSIIFFAFSIPILIRLVRIIFSTKTKYRFYKISLYRLKTRGYKDEYFEDEMSEPCFRLIICDILNSHNLKDEWKQLKLKCKGRNIKLEKTESELLKKVQEKYEKMPVGV